MEALLERRVEPDGPIGQALAEWRAGVVEDLGGEEALSTAEHALLNLAVREDLIRSPSDGSARIGLSD